MSGTTRRPPHARRSWLFCEGASERALADAASTGADVLIQELEDFTPPALRPRARALSEATVAAWRAAGAVAAVRINPLESDGADDLREVMRGAPDCILLPKANWPDQVDALDRAITRLEEEYGITAGSTEIVPNIELALGLTNTLAICRASERVTGCLVASEDMAADLGAERGPDGAELAYVRARFHAECTAAGTVSIDCPYTWTDLDGARAEARYARRLGYRAKSAVHAGHIALINDVFTPDPAEIAHARRVTAAFEAAQARGEGRIEVDGSLVEVPIYLNARRLLERAAELGVG